MSESVCPWWAGYILVNPLRRLFQKPQPILSPYIRSGMTTLDIGCGMGFLSLDMAKLVGQKGRVVCVDLQKEMMRTLVRRGEKAGLKDRIDHRICSNKSLGLEDLNNKIDFAVAFYIVHEVPNQQILLEQAFSLIKPGGKFLIAEPIGHVSLKNFMKTKEIALNTGFMEVERPKITRSYTMLLTH